MNYAPPIQGGIHMMEEDDQFHIAVTIRNLTDKDVHLQTMDSRLFSVSLKERDFETGYEHLWSPATGAMQAVTHWTLEPDGRVTQHYTVPNRDAAEATAQEYCNEFDFYDDPDELLDSGEFPYVDPDDVGLVTVNATLPASPDYSLSLSRQYDLRHGTNALDDELPEATRDGIESGY